MRLLWLPPRVSFFLTSETHVVISFVSYPFDTTLSLSVKGHSSSDNNTRSLSLSLLRRSLTRFVFSDVPAGLSHSPPLAARALRIALNFSLQKASAAVGRPAARAWRRKRQSRRRLRCPPRCRRGRDAASDPPPRPRWPRRKSSSRWKLIGPFYWNSSAIFLSDELCSFAVWNADGVCCSGLDV
jgi:hypothetical protein